MTLLRSLTLALALALPVQTATAQDEAGTAMLILDGSGSMWGQIDGVPKISIARDTLRDVLGELPTNVALGLMAYGHNRRGDCSDIEVLVPPTPGPAAASAIVGAAEALSPKGKTPLTEAVRQAADAMRYTEERATVVLVTDGLETCEADPCALATELERLGVDFTTHVVGFGLSAEEGDAVRCLADNTGGTYIQAADAPSLNVALLDTVAPRTAAVTLVALDQNDVRVNGTLGWTLRSLDDGTLAGEATGSSLSTDLLRGRYLALVDGDVAQGGLEFVVDRLDAQTIGVPVERLGTAPPVQPAAPSVADDNLLVADDRVDMGRPFDVSWRGEGASADWISIFDPAARRGEGERVTYVYLGDENVVELIAPAKPGSYELRYHQADPAEVLATRTINVLPVATALEVPESTAMGRPVTVGWQGPGRSDDYVELWDPSANRGEGGRVAYVYLGAEGDSVEVIAPAVPGSYELRYRHGKYGDTLATAELDVTGIDVGLDGPAAVAPEEGFVVGWRGPGRSDDFVAIYPEGSDSYTSYAYLGREGDSVSLTAPDTPGRYELRYVHGRYGETLANAPLEVR